MIDTLNLFWVLKELLLFRLCGFVMAQRNRLLTNHHRASGCMKTSKMGFSLVVCTHHYSILFQFVIHRMRLQESFGLSATTEDCIEGPNTHGFIEANHIDLTGAARLR